MDKFIISFLVVLVICLPYESHAQSQSVLIAASDWAPYTSPDIQHDGFLTEIVTTAFRRVGYMPEVKFVPWKNGVELTKDGEYDALLGASYTEERTAYFLYPDYAWKNEMFFFGRTGHGRQYKTLKDLCPATVGIIRGSSFIDRLSPIACLKLEEVNTVRQNIFKVVSERTDLFLDSKDSLDYLLRTELSEYKETIEPVRPSFEMDKIYLVVSKKHPQHKQIAADFDRGIVLIKTDGTYQKILADHGMTPLVQEKK